MPSITIIDNYHATLLYEPEHKIVHHIFHEAVGGEAFRSVLRPALDLFREHHAEKWLLDDSSDLSLQPADAEWGQREWIPVAREAGWKYWALVVPPGIEARSSLLQVVQAVATLGVHTRTFQTSDEARAWLESF